MNCIRKTFPVPFEKSKTVSFAYSRMKLILDFPDPSNFAAKLICLIALGSASNTFCLIRSIKSFCNNF